jgi:hypothetical protein
MWQVGEKVSGGPLSACTRAPNKKTHQNATIKKCHIVCMTQSSMRLVNKKNEYSFFLSHK